MLAHLALLATACLLASAGPAAAADLPIFDAHVHYNAEARAVISPEQALELLSRAGIRRAVVSSTPDDGTLALHARAPARIVPFLRPYRSDADRGGWHADPAVQAFVEERLGRAPYRGIGEFHLSGADAGGPVVRRLAELARARDLFLYPHADDATVERMLDLYPGVKILWAHAGMTARPAAIRRLLARSPRLWVELSLRGDVAPGGSLDPGWRALLLDHRDRFLLGSDTFVTPRWHELPGLVDRVQEWLAQLPAEVAERIAFRNGDRLFPAP